MNEQQQADAEQSVHHLEQQRRENRDAMRALGAKPYGVRTDELVTLAEARSRYDEAADEANKASVTKAKAYAKENPDAEPVPIVDERPRVRVAGRVVLKREGGKLVWLQLRDHTTASAGDIERGDAPASVASDLQIAVSKRDVEAPGFDLMKPLDLGDIVVVEGPLMRTNKGEITIWASRVEMGSKSLAPPPEKWKGLTDIEQRYRRRYVDLHANPESMFVLSLRSKIVTNVRRFLDARGFMEVDTPVLQSLAGGAAARPFVTHMNALDIDLFMRIAPELYLKRLLVGGMPRVYEVSRNFRNEGLSPRHNPEFTSLELYEAFGDYHTMSEITESLVRSCAELVAEAMGGSARALPFGDLTIDYASDFAQITFADLFEKALGFPMTDHDRALQEAETRGFKTKSEKGVALDPILIVNELFEEVAERSIDPAKPTFVFDYPSALSPLTRPHESDPSLAQRWDLFIGGMEIGPAYTELNDPDVQEAKFREQLAGIDDEESTFRTFDEDFIRALKVGMPPAGGMGLGIDRLCMLLMDQQSIRDVLLFPMMRPEVE